MKNVKHQQIKITNKNTFSFGAKVKKKRENDKLQHLTNSFKLMRLLQGTKGFAQRSEPQYNKSKKQFSTKQRDVEWF